MSKKTANKTQETWQGKLTRAKAVKKAWSDTFRVQMMWDYLEGRQKPPNAVEEEWITINKVYTAAKTILPNLYGQDPYFYVSLKRSYTPDPELIAAWEMRGKIRAANLNYYKTELKLKRKMWRSIRDALIEFGVLKYHFLADVKENPEAGNPVLDDTGEAMMDGEGVIEVEPDEIPVNDRYAITRVHPEDFLWDEDASADPETWKWVAQRFRVPKDEAEKDRRFAKSVLKALSGSEHETDEDQKSREQRKKGNSNFERSGQKGTDNPDVVVYWEIYLIKEKKWLVIAEEATAPLMDETDQPDGIKGGHPFAILVFFERDDSPYPIPPLSQGLDPQKEYNLARSAVVTHRKRFNRKYELDATAFDEPQDAADKLTSGEDGTVIIKSRSTGFPAVTAIQDAQLDQMRYAEINLLNNDMMELFEGSTGASRGIADADSATEAGILEQRLKVRETDLLAMVTDFVQEGAAKLDMLIQTYIDQEQAVNIVGPDGNMWVTVRPEDYEEIDGDYAYEIAVGSTVPQLPQMERASFMAVLGVLGQAPQLMTSPQLVKEICKMHHLDNQKLIEEIVNIGKAMMQAQAQAAQAKGAGSQAGVSEQNPAAMVGGQAGGPQSLMLPGAGNLQG